MNKSVMIIICDFLLLSLMLALSRPEGDGTKDDTAADVAQVASAASPQEVVEVLKQSLEEERLAREQLNEQLAASQAALTDKDTLLATRDQRMLEVQETLQRKEAEARKLDKARTELERTLAAKETALASRETNLTTVQQRYEQAQSSLAAMERQQAITRQNMEQLQQQHAAARTNATALQEKLSATVSEASVSKQVLTALQDDLRKQVAASTELQRQLQAAELVRQKAEADKAQLGTKLQVAETEKRLTKEQLDAMRTEVRIVRQEKARIQEQTTQLAQNTTKLAENVSVLAESSEKLTDEIRSARPLTANAIFAEFSTNRVQSTFQLKRDGIFGQNVSKEVSAKTILVSRGSQIFAIYHLEDTPIALEQFPSPWKSLAGTLGHAGLLYSMTQLSFLDRDPRIVIVPIGRPQAEKLGLKIYPVAEDPYKFQEAILIGATDGYYGESKFQVDPETPHYVRMQRERFSRLSGKFLPSRGDLVFSKTGEVLGMMANKEYCLVLDNFAARRTIPIGPIVEQPTSILTQMYEQATALPFRLH